MWIVFHSLDPRVNLSFYFCGGLLSRNKLGSAIATKSDSGPRKWALTGQFTGCGLARIISLNTECSNTSHLVTSSWYFSILMYHECVPIAQYLQSRTEIVEVRLSQRSIFVLAYWKLIVMEIIAKNSTWVMYNFWEAGSENEQAWRGSACVHACLSPDQRLQRTDAPPKSEDGSSSEVNRPEFTLSHSYKFIRQQSEICAELSHIMPAWVAGFEKDMRYPFSDK